MDLEKHGFSREHDDLILSAYNAGAVSRANSVGQIIFTNLTITLLVVHSASTGSWISGVIGGGWILLNTAASAAAAWTQGPLWRSFVDRLEEILGERPTGI